MLCTVEALVRRGFGRHLLAQLVTVLLCNHHLMVQQLLLLHRHALIAATLRRLAHLMLHKCTLALHLLRDALRVHLL